MRGKLSLVLASLFIFLFCFDPPLASAASPKKGSTCLHVGTTFGSGSNTLICKYVGKKKIWALKPKSTLTDFSTTSPNTKTPSSALRDETQLQDIAACTLANRDANLFHLGLPVSPVIKDLRTISVAAIPIVFSDSSNFLVSDSQINSTFSNITRYYDRESFGRTKLNFTGLPGSGRFVFSPISLDVSASESPFVSNRGVRIDMDPWINKVLNKAPSNWDLGNYDAVLIYFKDSRPNNFYGGQAWRGQSGNAIGQLPFNVSSGEIKALVFSNSIETVLTHELGHAIFGFVDLYDGNGQQSFTNGWGLMAAAYQGTMGIFGWEKFLAGWMSEKEVLCGKAVSNSFLQFSETASSGSKMLVYPIDDQTAVAIEAIDLSTLPLEADAHLVICSTTKQCIKRSGTGLLAYEVHVDKLSALGAIQVPSSLAYPNLINDNSTQSILGLSVKNLGCNNLGCRVAITKP
jgi:M6 family metalloprotease-like protein